LPLVGPEICRINNKALARFRSIAEQKFWPETELN
jgi:hypothetical protein